MNIISVIKNCQYIWCFSICNKVYKIKMSFPRRTCNLNLDTYTVAGILLKEKKSIFFYIL